MKHERPASVALRLLSRLSLLHGWIGLTTAVTADVTGPCAHDDACTPAHVHAGQVGPKLVRAPLPDLLPSAPGKPTASGVTDTSVSLTWEAPVGENSDDDDDDDDEIEAYSIEWFSADLRSGWVVAADRVQGRRYTVAGLRPDTAYVFVVRARNSYGLGRTSPISKTVRTAERAGGSAESGRPLGSSARAELSRVEVKIRNAKPINSTAVSLEWTVAGDREYVEGYYVWFRDMAAAEDKYSMATAWGGKRSRFVLRDLNKFTRYDIFLVPFFKTLKGSPSNIKTVTTFEDTPTAAVRDISVNVANATSVWVQWSPPPVHEQNGALQGYKLILLGEIETANRNVLTNQTHFVFTNLVDKMRYRLQILAYTSVGDGPPSRFVELSTDEEFVKGLATDAKDKEPWLVLLLSAVLCFILITISFGILFFLCKRQRDLKAVTVTSVPVSKGGDVNHLFASLNQPVGTQNWSQVYSCTDATKEKEVLYENKVMNILDGVKYCTEYTPLNLQREEGEYAEVGGQQKLNTFGGAFAGFTSGHAPTFPEPYASTTILASLPVNPGHQRLPDALLHGRAQPGRQSVRSVRSNGGGGSGGLAQPPSPHELEGLLQARKSFSDASNNGDSSSFSTRSERSSRSSGRVRASNRTGIPHHHHQQHPGHQAAVGSAGALAMRNLSSVAHTGGGMHSDSTSVSEDDSTGVHSWSRTSTGGRRGEEEPIYNSVPEEQQNGRELVRGGSDRSDYSSVVGRLDSGVTSSGVTSCGVVIPLSTAASRDDDIMVPKFSRSLCTPLNKKKTLDLVPETAMDSHNGCSITDAAR
ncbi:roundabout1-like [Tropilaelaps mercedesae]|uniref:Roundabout1-like n=1 Tax=Tropilaelaps mercedesae TaxID=418985 RepID=A0A1V9X4X1_9ACAR|nr:roundabout1-like [Tropilaelaps mercedesae]